MRRHVLTNARFQDAHRSSVQLLDGTAAMVRCMRKGNGALECPVCLQLFNAPVVPIESDCRWGMCHVPDNTHVIYEVCMYTCRLLLRENTCRYWKIMLLG